MIDEKFISDKLKSYSLRLSKPKLKVLNFLYEQKKPCSVQQILSSNCVKSLNKTSLYRMMENLKKCELVIDFVDNKGIKRFEFVTKHHHHIECSSCQFIECIQTKKDLEEICNSLQKTFSNFKKISHKLEFIGICKTCFSKT
jgi:Fur family transcriptional regulator, peroxide stress response regulator